MNESEEFITPIQSDVNTSYRKSMGNKMGNESTDSFFNPPNMGNISDDSFYTPTNSSENMMINNMIPKPLENMNVINESSSTSTADCKSQITHDTTSNISSNLPQNIAESNNNSDTQSANKDYSPPQYNPLSISIIPSLSKSNLNDIHSSHSSPSRLSKSARTPVLNANTPTFIPTIPDLPESKDAPPPKPKHISNSQRPKLVHPLLLRKDLDQSDRKSLKDSEINTDKTVISGIVPQPSTVNGNYPISVPDLTNTYINVESEFNSQNSSQSYPQRSQQLMDYFGDASSRRDKNINQEINTLIEIDRELYNYLREYTINISSDISEIIQNNSTLVEKVKLFFEIMSNSSLMNNTSSEKNIKGEQGLCSIILKYICPDIDNKIFLNSAPFLDAQICLYVCQGLKIMGKNAEEKNLSQISTKLRCLEVELAKPGTPQLTPAPSLPQYLYNI